MKKGDKVLVIANVDGFGRQGVIVEVRDHKWPILVNFEDEMIGYQENELKIIE